jgi:hypothetical protein
VCAIHLLLCFRYSTTQDMSHCSLTTDQAVQVVSTVCRGLTAISLNQCPLLSHVAMDALSANCRLLKRIHAHNFNRLTDASLALAGARLSHIVKLTLSSCDAVRNQWWWWCFVVVVVL